MRSANFIAMMISAGETHKELVSDNAMKWYSGLDIHQKINLKELMVVLTGEEWCTLTLFLDFSERVTLAYDKLKMEGFDV